MMIFIRHCKHTTDFVMEYNTTIANNDVFSESKVENLQLIANQYRDILQKAMLSLASGGFA